MVQLEQDLGFVGEPTQEGPLVTLGVEDLDGQLRSDPLARVAQFLGQVGDARPPDGDPLLHGVGAIESVSPVQKGAPACFRSGASAAQVWTGLDVLFEGRQASTAVAGPLHLARMVLRLSTLGL